MGKKRIIAKSDETIKEEERLNAGHGRPSTYDHDEDGEAGRSGGMRGVAHILATYNNTLITVTDERGNAVASSSAGALGFSGAKKATPFAAARVAESLMEKIRKAGIQEVLVLVSGVGSGRDSAVRALANHGLNIIGIKDRTPVPHNGPRSKKVRRV